MTSSEIWSVSTLEEFLQFCCPECDVKEKSKNKFINHALHFHPEAKIHLSNLITETTKQNYIVSEEIQANKNNLEYEQNNDTMKDLDTFQGVIIKKEVVEDDEISENNLQSKILDTSDNTDFILNNVKCELQETFPWQEEEYEHNENITENLNSEENLIEITTSRPSRIVVMPPKKKKKYDVVVKIPNPNISKRPEYSENTIVVEQEPLETMYGDPNTSKNTTSKNTQDKKLLNFQCEFCEKRFEKLPNLQIHIGRVHSELKSVKVQHKCDSCEKVFSRAEHLKRHITAVHNGQKDHKCDACGKTFSQSWELVRHINGVHNGQTDLKIVHKGQKELKCKFCGEKFTQAGKLKLHLSTAHEDHLFHCNICSITFTTKGSQKRHVLEFHEGRNLQGKRHIVNM